MIRPVIVGRHSTSVGIRHAVPDPVCQIVLQIEQRVPAWGAEHVGGEEGARVRRGADVVAQRERRALWLVGP